MTLMESVCDCMSRHMHICGLLKVILQGFGSAPPVPPKAEAVDLMLGCWPPTASSKSPDVLASLLVAPPCSGNYADRQQTLPQLALMWDKLRYLSHMCGL